MDWLFHTDWRLPPVHIFVKVKFSRFAERLKIKLKEKGIYNFSLQPVNEEFSPVAFICSRTFILSLT